MYSITSLTSYVTVHVSTQHWARHSRGRRSLLNSSELAEGTRDLLNAIKPTQQVRGLHLRRSVHRKTMAELNNSKRLQKAGLGRPLTLGMLYDCRSDKCVSNLLFWKPELLAGATTRMSVTQKVSEIVEEFFAQKARCLEIDNELQLSILAGLVDVKGAAKYLTDYKSSMDQNRIGLLYKQTTKIERLSLDKLSDQFLDRIESATHVVTEVEYGATAVFVFDANSCKHDDLLAKVSVLKQHLLSSSDVVHLSDNFDVSCTLYADVPCPKVPTTLPEVSHACQSLQVYLAKEANCVPVRVWLCPISELNNKAHKLSLREVSPKLNSKIQAIFEPLHELEMRSRCISNSEVCEHIVGIKDDLRNMIEMLASYCLTVKSRLADLLPKVREGDADESCLLQVLEDNETSPFNHTVLRSWIEGKETEVAILGNYIKSLKQEKKVRFAFQPNEMAVLSNSIEIDTIVCFDFNIIGGKDPQLSKMRSHHLNEKKADPQYLEPWYCSASIKKEMKKQVRCFLQLVGSNAEQDDVVFAVTSGCSEVAKVSGKIPLMCRYTDGNPPVSFEPPSKPGKPKASMFGDSIDPSVSLSYSPAKTCFENYQESEGSDQIKTKNFSPPGKPYAGEVTHDSIQLKWNEPEDGAEVVKFYKINYRSTQDKPGQWSMLSTTSPLECFTITGLQQQSAYVFQVSAVFSESYCKDSQVSDEIQTKVFVSIPGKPIAIGTTCETIQLSWSKPTHGADLVSSYEIHVYKPRGEEQEDQEYQEDQEEVSSCPSARGDHLYINNKWSPLAEGLTEECFTASNLIPGTFYHFMVLANTPTGVQESETSDSIQTEPLPLSIRLRNCCPEIMTKGGNFSIHQLIGTTTMNKREIVMIDVGMNARKITFQHKVLMLVGATGAGKSALINGITNYITGVKWEDDFRFILIPEGSSQTTSQTRQITAYRFLDSILPYTLTVIDTPGFGDTSGIAKDKEIRQLIKEFFSSSCGEGIDQINAIGFVAQANLPRLTVSQKYIFENVLTLFGKDISSNVFLITTFADGHEPQVLGAVKEAIVPYESYFKFNNSAIFASNRGDIPFDAMFWKMGMESFALFFEGLSKAEPRSLTLTRQVLVERDQLEKIIQSLQPRIQTSLAKIDELNQEEAILQKQKETIDSTKDFKYTVRRTEKRKITLPDKKYTTTCLTCDYTCHEKCSKSNDSKKYYCSVMKTKFGTKDACCVVCPKECRWDEHVNTPYKWEHYQVVEVRTYYDLKARYDTAVSGKMKKEVIIERLRDEIEKCQNEALSIIKEVKSCLERLNEIALRPNAIITEVEYINILIESKQQEQKLGWQEEVRALEKLRETAELQYNLMFDDPEAVKRKIGIKETI